MNKTMSQTRNQKNKSTVKNKTVLWGLLACIILQLCVLLGMYLKAQYPLWVGTPIKVAVEPIDPRSLFRGNYAILNYTISQAKLNSELLEEGAEHNPLIHEQAVVYTRLKANKDGLYEPIDVVLEKPNDGVFIRGRIKSRYISDDGLVRIEYGVEAYFAPKERALEIEHSARWRANADSDKPPAVVTLKIAPSGHATIESLTIISSEKVE